VARADPGSLISVVTVAAVAVRTVAGFHHDVR
jgi:hypothetical protein